MGFFHKVTYLTLNPQVFYYYVAMTNQRFLYYVPWCLTDGSVIASGLGYNGYDKETKKHKFDRIYSIAILEVEMGLTSNSMVIVRTDLIIFSTGIT